MADWIRFDKALFRCLNEIEIVKAQRIAHIELRRVIPESESIYSGFPGLVNAAFNFATQGTLALVLERHTTKRRSGFWWLHETAIKEVSGYEPKRSDIAFLEKISSGFKTLRNNTLFHITEDSLQDPMKLRKDTELNYTKIDQAISFMLGILRELLRLRRSSATWTQGTGVAPTLNYDGSDIEQIFHPR